MPAPKTIRLTHAEQELIKIKCLEINAELIHLGKSPISGSELVHQVLAKGIPTAVVNSLKNASIKKETARTL